MPEASPDSPATKLPAAFDPRYVVERELGRGAMGRVFLARDLRLDRLVAIKALAPGNRDEQDLRRLELEARTAGSLNHPNILAVHDIGSSEGGPFIVSEYLRGQNLRQLLDAHKEQLAPWQVVNLMSQFAAGLAAAHENNIVHRDLKPENLFITEEGWLKILDFGIAKRSAETLVPHTPPAVPRLPLPEPQEAPPRAGALSPPPNSRFAPPPGESAIPTPPSLPTPAEVRAMTELQPLTNPGAIMGTVGYMSPEQVRGQPADARSDIFAFGVILYELLASARAFQGKTPFAISLAILKDEPAPLPAAALPELRELATQCLRKDPAQRPQQMREIARQLEVLRATGEHPRVPARLSRRWWGALALLLLVAGGAVGVAVKFAFRSPPSFKQITFHPGAVWSARFGPDGRVFYSAAWDAKPPRIYVTTPGNPDADATPLDLPESQLASVSRTGDLAVLLKPHFIGASFGGGELAVVRGGKLDERVIAKGVDLAEFAPDGGLALVRSQDGQHQIEYPPGKPIFSTPGSIASMRFSPHGDKLAFAHLRQAGYEDGDVCVLDVATGQSTVVLPGVAALFGVAWGPAGDELWFSGSTAHKVKQVGVHAVTLSGHERTLAQVASELLLSDVSPAGEALVTQLQRRMQLASTDRPGSAVRDLSIFDRSFLDDVSASGDLVLVTVAGQATPAGEETVYLRPTNGSPRRLGVGASGAISRDGSIALAFNSHSATLHLPNGEQKLFETNGLALSLARFTPDGRAIIASANEPGKRTRLFRLSFDGAVPVPLTPEGSPVNGLFISVDGTQIAFSSNGSAPALVGVSGDGFHPVPGATATERVVGWTDQGKLIVGTMATAQVRVYSLDPQTGARQTLGDLSVNDSGAIMISRVMVPPSGKPLFYNFFTLSTHLYLVKGSH